MKQIACGIWAALFLFFLNPAASRGDELIAVAQISPLVEWVETKTNLMLLPRPKIFVSDTALLKLAAYKNDDESTREPIAAYHNGVIFIKDAYWRSDNLADESVIVHELTHYAQDIDGQHYACANQREAEAYRMQNLFLAEHGQRAFLDADEIERLEQCD